MNTRIVLCNNCEHTFLPKDNTPQFPLLDSLNDLLRSNRLPSSKDTEDVRAYIKVEECELARCEQEIYHLDDALQALKAHRATLLDRVKRCRSWFSPIRRLPVEILRKIFTFICTPESGTYALDVQDWTISAPILTLTYVSHHWREVVSASPSLWSSIRVRISYTNLNRVQMMHVLSLYLANSRDHPLHLINFRFTQGYQGRQDPIIQLLAPHMPRIARLDLTGPVDEDRYSDLEWLATSLRHNAVPKLSDMTIYPLFLGLPSWDILPFHQLRVLEIADAIDNTQALGPVLRLCTNLHSLTLRLLYHGHSDELDALIEIPSLRQLEVAVTSSSAILLPLLLAYLVLPSLSSFRISTYDVSFLPLVTDLVHRSGCHLEDFIMEISYGRYDVSNADKLGDFLTSCPDLSHLKVDVLDPSHSNVDAGTSVCQLLDVLSSVSSRQMSVPSPTLSYVIVSERRRSNLNPETVDALLGKLEARIGALADYRARVPVPRWKWNLRFGALGECAPDVLEGFKRRIDKLAKSGLQLET